MLGEFFHATGIRRRLLTATVAARAIDAFLDAFAIAAIQPALVAKVFSPVPSLWLGHRRFGGREMARVRGFLTALRKDAARGFATGTR